MRRIKKNRVVTFLAVIGLLVFLYFIGVLKPAENFISRMLNPVLSDFYSLGSDIRFAYNKQTTKVDLFSEVEGLRKEVNRLTEENANLKTLEQENEILREHLDFYNNKEYNYVLANVISRGEIGDLEGQIEKIVIDRGGNSGVISGAAVVSSEGIVVGKVSVVKENISEVLLSNNSKCKFAATILNEDKTSGITEGKLGLTIEMNFIPQDREVKDNDIIITSGLEQLIPRGLVIGKIVGVQQDSNELWQIATIEPMVSPESLIIVSVLLP